MCQDVGVKVIYLPLFSLHLNFIEEFFTDLKAHIKSQWALYDGIIDRDFCAFLEWFVERAGRNWDSAQAHFRHAGYSALQVCAGNYWP